MDIYLYTCMYFLYVLIYSIKATYIIVGIDIFVCVYIYTHLYICMYMCMYIYIYTDTDYMGFLQRRMNSLGGLV